MEKEVPYTPTKGAKNKQEANKTIPSNSEPHVPKSLRPHMSRALDPQQPFPYHLIAVCSLDGGLRHGHVREPRSLVGVVGLDAKVFRAFRGQ